jgi:hypothetical protein
MLARRRNNWGLQEQLHQGQSKNSMKLLMKFEDKRGPHIWLMNSKPLCEEMFWHKHLREQSLSLPLISSQFFKTTLQMGSKCCDKINKWDLDKQIKNANVESLIFVILGSFQNCTFLKNWRETLHSIYSENFVSSRSHAYESCGKEMSKMS